MSGVSTINRQSCLTSYLTCGKEIVPEYWIIFAATFRVIEMIWNNLTKRHFIILVVADYRYNGKTCSNLITLTKKSKIRISESIPILRVHVSINILTPIGKETLSILVCLSNASQKSSWTAFPYRLKYFFKNSISIKLD